MAPTDHTGFSLIKRVLNRVLTNDGSPRIAFHTRRYFRLHRIHVRVPDVAF